MVYVTWILLALWFAGPFIYREPRAMRISIAVTMIASLAPLAGMFRVNLIPGHHAMYVDEPWYEEAAKNFIHRGQLILCVANWSGENCEPYPKSAGWPAILVIPFKLFGPSEHMALMTCLYLGVCAVLFAAMATFFAGGKWHQQVLTSALIGMNPVFLNWWMTAETNVPAITFLLVGLIRTVLPLTPGSAAMIAGGLGVAAAIRPELWLAFVPVLIVAARRRRERPVASAILAGGAILGALPGLMSAGNYMTHNSGALFAPSNFLANTLLWVRAPGEGGWLSLLIVIVALVYWWRNRSDASLVLGGSMLLIGVFVLFYYPPAGFYSRTMLGAVAPATVLASLALPDSRVGKFMAVFLVVALIGWTWQSRGTLLQAPETQVAETQLAELEHRIAWPPNSLVLAEWPTVIEATSDIPAMSASRAISDWDRLDAEVARRPVFLACDMFCENSNSDCRRLLDRYSLAPAQTIGGPHRAYGFFRITGRAPEGPHKPICPIAH